MNKSLLILSLALAPSVALAQGAIDAYRFSQPDLKGTARFMGMAGAFGALGGDLSTLSQNPAGIGVYRSGDVGLTLNLDCQSSSSNSQNNKVDVTQTKFLLNNAGVVATLRLDNDMFPNFNFGVTYNKGASFNRLYAGRMPRLDSSLSNYVAGIANSEGLTENDLAESDAYNPPVGYYAAPWMTVLGYDGYLITPSGTGSDTWWDGQFGEGTTGNAFFYTQEKGSFDEFNVAFGGNISNVVYWGMNFDIVNFNYTLNSLWNENLDGAYVPDAENNIVREAANWDLNNYYHVHGSGFKYSLGVILKPIQEIRLGFAFHTPTWMNLTESFGANISYDYGGERGVAYTNDGYLGYNDFCFRTPMKFIASAAGVIGGKFILSFDYEWTPYSKMKLSEAGSYGSSGWYDDDYWPYNAPAKGPEADTRSYVALDDAYYYENSDIKTYYQATNTFRIGAEYRINSAFSVRAGYSHVSSPVKSEAANNLVPVWTSGTLPSYRFDKKTDYITCGLGYRYRKFYVDMAYVYKNMKSEYHAYTPDVIYDNSGQIVDVNLSPQSSLSLSNSQVVLTAGFRF